MSTQTLNAQEIDEKIHRTLIRDLVEEYPEVMSILNQFGIDICCGGGLTVPQAAEAHQLDTPVVKNQVIRAIRGKGN